MDAHGNLLSMDLLVGVLGLLLFLQIALYSLNDQTLLLVEHTQDWSQLQTALQATDTLVKNRVPQHPFLGAARFDAAANRVRPNELDLELLEQAIGKNDIAPFYFQAIELEFWDNTIWRRETVPTASENCRHVRRIVWAGQKAVLRAQVCS